MPYAIESKHISKSFDGVPALQNLSLQIEPGIVYGLLGPNDAGKSTLLRVLLGFLGIDKGSLRVLGSANLDAARAQIGYLPQTPAYHTRGTAREYLHFLGRLNGLTGAALSTRVVEELEAFGLSSIADRTIDSFTAPALQRLGLAQAMIKRPALLLLDEPTAGTEAEDRSAIIDILAGLRSRVETMVFATHNLGEAELLCDRVGILSRGQLMADVRVAEMRGSGRNALITVTELSPALALKLCSLHPAVQCSSYEVALQPNSPELQALVLHTLLSAGVPIVALEPFGRPLEELYARAIQGQIEPTYAQPNQVQPVPDQKLNDDPEPAASTYVTQPIPLETTSGTESPPNTANNQAAPSNEAFLNELLRSEKRQEP